jgi:hypothetical protein
MHVHDLAGAALDGADGGFRLAAIAAPLGPAAAGGQLVPIPEEQWLASGDRRRIRSADEWQGESEGEDGTMHVDAPVHASAYRANPPGQPEAFRDGRQSGLEFAWERSPARAQSFPSTRCSMPTRAALLIAIGASAGAVEWTWSWTPAPGDRPAAASVAPLKYGKEWAYAVEIDDGPKWVLSFAVPFLAAHAYTDAPPGVPGGRRMPFVGSVAVIAASTGFNSANVDWDDLRALGEAGWGAMNHSFDHRGNHWEEKARLDDRAVAEDAYWSQTLLAAGLPTATSTTTATTSWPRRASASPPGWAAAARATSPARRCAGSTSRATTSMTASG